MKKTRIIVAAALAMLVFTGCSSLMDWLLSPSSGSNSLAAERDSQSAPAAPIYYSGDGGKGISIAILAPKTNGLTANQGYIPLVAQGELVSNFSGYSAISVMDRENLDKVYGELLSGYYDDNNKAGLDLGHLTATDYVMTGSITKTATGYALQMQITKTADKMTRASYSGTCTFAELDNLTGIRRASLDLLSKLGVELTPAAKAELAGAATANHVNAQTALAQGITAQQKGGTIVETLSYYYEAAQFDPSLAEATSRSSVMSASIQSGNIGANVRNDIQARAAWLKTLNEAAAFFKEHPPFEIVYDPKLTEGKIDYAKETVDISFDVYLIDSTGFKVIKDLKAGLELTPGSGKWGLDSWPNYGDAAVFVRGILQYTVNAALVNDKGKTIGTVRGELYGKYYYSHDYFLTKEKLFFKGVNANDITDGLTVSITSVNGMDAKTAGAKGYISIRTMRPDDVDRRRGWLGFK